MGEHLAIRATAHPPTPHPHTHTLTTPQAHGSKGEGWFGAKDASKYPTTHHGPPEQRIRSGTAGVHWERAGEAKLGACLWPFSSFCFSPGPDEGLWPPKLESSSHPSQHGTHRWPADGARAPTPRLPLPTGLQCGLEGQTGDI